MAWLGNGLSQITGQISNFTKEVLTEGTEEVDDHATELRLARTRVADLETHCLSFKAEVDRMKGLNDDLSEKLESAELQVKAISSQYRAQLDEREEEVKLLKQTHNEFLEQQSKMAAASPSSSSSLAPLSHSASMPSFTAFNVDDEDDFGDVISSQHEINRLRSEVQRLQAQCQHWRQVAGAQETSCDAGNEVEGSQEHTAALHTKIKELQQQLRDEVDQHQHELLVLQDVHGQKLATLKKKHKDDLRELQEETQQQGANEVESDLKQKLDDLQMENSQLLADLKETTQLKNQLEKQLSVMEEERQKLIANEKSLQEQILSSVSGLSSTQDEGDADMQKALRDASLPSSTPIPAEKRRSSISSLAEEVRMLREKLTACEKDAEQFELERSDWLMEKEALEDVLLKLRQQVQGSGAGEKGGASDMSNSAPTGNHDSQSVGEREAALLQELVKQKQRVVQLESEHAEKNGSSSGSGEQVTSLQKELEANYSEMIDLLSQLQEKDSHLKLLTSQVKTLESSLKSREDELSRLQIDFKKEDGDSMEAVGPLQIKVAQELEDKVEVLNCSLQEMTQERDSLISSLEELDAQNQLALEQMIQNRDQLLKKNEDLQVQLETLDTSLNTVTDSRKKEEKDIQTLKGHLEGMKEEHSQLLVDKEHCDKIIAELNDKLKDGAITLNEERMDKQALVKELSILKDERDSKSKSWTNEKSELEKKCCELESNLNSTREDLKKIHDSSLQGNSLKDQLASDNENLSKEIEQKTRELETSSSRIFDLEEEVNNLQGLLTSVNQEKLDLCAKLESEKNLVAEQKEIAQSFSNQVRDLKTQIDSLTSQRKSLERELNQSEQKVHDQAKHYDSYIAEIKDSQVMDSSALQEEHRKVLKASHEKDLTISELETKCGDLQRELEDSKDLLHSTIGGQKQITDMLSDKEVEISGLRTENVQLTENCDENNIVIKRLEAELARLVSLESKYKQVCDDIKKLKLDNESLKSQLRQLESQEDSNEMDSRTLDVITDLESEVAGLNMKLFEGQSQIQMYEQEIRQLKDIIKDQDTNLSLANVKCEEHSKMVTQSGETIKRQETVIKNFQQTVSHREQELVAVLSKLEKAKSLLNEEQLGFIEDPSSQVPDKVIRLQNEQKQQKPNNVEEGESLVNGESLIMKNSMSELRDIISEKDDVISELQGNNAALLEMLEERSLAVHGDQTLVQVHKLEGEIQNMRKEREQMMSVLNEKSRECSNLKSETHRLMSVISAEKVALAKLQQDNQELMKNNQQEVPNPDMTRDAVKNLSRIIRDKDLEIESLNQKNQTLLQVLQESSSAGNQVAGLMAERDNLSKQLAVWQADREQIIAAINQKHQESLAYHSELQRVTGVCNQHSEEMDKLKQQYQTLSQQYEDKQQQLVKAQNEVINYKHKYQESDNRYQELLQQKGGANPTQLEESVREAELQSKELKSLKDAMVEMEISLKAKCEDLLTKNQIISEKEKNIGVLSGKCRQMEESIYTKDCELGALKKQAENAQFQMAGLHTELEDVHQERDELSQQNRAVQSEVNILKDSHQKLSMFLGEKDFEINALKEKANTLAKLVAEKGGDEKGEMDRMMRESEAMQGQAQAFQQERDQALVALQHTQAEAGQFRDQVSKLTERERKLGRELERLRSHLIMIEEGYTLEALAAEEREKELRNRLATAEERVSSSSSAVRNASEQASAQVESLQRQLHALAEQRDAAVLQLASAQDTANQYAASLNNLQMVLEQFQQERDTQIAVELERYQKALEHTKTENGALHEKCNILQTQLEESQETIEAAHRLSEQLDRKEEAVMALKEEVLLREKQLLKVEEELQKLSSSTEAKVDKIVIKNLFLGYFHTPANKRREVLQLIGKVLSFSPEEMEQASSESNQSRGWLGLGGLLRRTPPHPTTPPNTPHKASFDKSFSELFVKFLEKESTPSLAVNMNLPAEAMAREQQVKNEQQQRQKPIFNPFSAPRHATMPIQVGGVQPDDSHLLMKPMAATLPTFSPLITPELTTPAGRTEEGSRRSSLASSGRSTPATTSAILRDVLQQ